MLFFRQVLRELAAILHPVPIPARSALTPSRHQSSPAPTAEIPVVIVHFGGGKYVRKAVKQAETMGNVVFLIGDKSNRDFAMNHCNAADYFRYAEEFRRHYQHMSFNPENSELACFMRWLILREFMEVHDLDVVFACDSDVMLYSDVTALWTSSAAYVGPVHVRAGQSAEYHCAQAGEGFWTRPDVARLCEIIMTSYESPQERDRLKKAFADLVSRGSQGGVSDMMMLGKFASEKGVPEGPVIFLSQSLCHNINDSEGVYETVTVWPRAVEKVLAVITDAVRKRGWLSLEFIISFLAQPRVIKAISWRHGLPYARLRDSGEPVRLHSLHFAGRAKRLIPRFERAAARSKASPAEVQ